MAEPKAAPKVIPVATPSGRVGYLPAEFAADAEDAGLRGASKGQMLEAQLHANEAARDDALREQFSKDPLSALEGGIAPQAAGFARGLTFGLSDVGLKGAGALLGGKEGGESVGHRLADYQDFSPIRSTVGEIGGAALPALMGEEAGLLKLTPAGLASSGARALEEGIVGGIGAESALGRVAAKSLGGAAAGAFENSLYEAGKTASDAAIHDEPLTAEKLVAGTGHGALFGGAVGGVLGALGGALATRGPRLADIEASTEAASVAPKGTLADHLQKTADVKTIKALGGSAGDLRTLEANVPGGFRKVAQDIRTDVEATTGQSIGHHSREALHEYATKRVEELGDKLGSMLEKLDTAHTGIAPSPKGFISTVRNDIIAPNLIIKADGTPIVIPGAEKTVSAVKNWIGRIEEAFSDRAPTFGEWQKIRRNLDQEINFARVNMSPEHRALVALRGQMEGELMAAGERAAQQMGTSFQAEYQATKSLYQSVKKAQELTTRGVSRDLANNSAGLTTRLAAMAGTSVGAGLGGAVGGMLGGAAGGAVGQVIQRRGDVLAADLLGRAATLMGANKIANRVTSELDTGVRRLVGGTRKIPEAAESGVRAVPPPLGVKASGNRRTDYARISDAVTAAVANPVATTDRVSRSVGELADHAPGTATAAIGTTLRGLDFLASKLPPSRQDPYSLQPQLQPRTRASDAEISRFMRYAEAVDDPLIVLREAKTNTLTRDHVEAVKAVYPRLYDEMRGSVFRSLVESKSELPYGKRIQLGILLDIPTDKTLSPEFVRAVQATFSASDQAGAESPPTTSAAPEIAGSTQTAMQMAVEHAQ